MKRDASVYEKLRILFMADLWPAVAGVAAFIVMILVHIWAPIAAGSP